MGKISNETKIEMLRKIIEIRRFEERTIQFYQRSKIWGYLHPYIGEEAVAVGACFAIDKKDYIVSTHRGHGHSIAKGADLRQDDGRVLEKVQDTAREEEDPCISPIRS
jgi:acetoin:2,6-dichlorophenolindophenol oxidoreductase subunit alpha